MERQWCRKKSYVMKWRQWGNIGETVVEYWRDSGTG